MKRKNGIIRNLIMSALIAMAMMVLGACTELDEIDYLLSDDTTVESQEDTSEQVKEPAQEDDEDDVSEEAKETDRGESKEPTVAITEKPTEEPVTYKYTFRNDDRFEDHYEKHGIEMGFATKEEYLAAANAVIANPDALTKTEAEDGDYIFFIDSTNEFVVLSTDGYIRTYYICSGVNYFNRQ